MHCFTSSAYSSYRPPNVLQDQNALPLIPRPLEKVAIDVMRLAELDTPTRRHGADSVLK
jgi:hypothetical protein